MAKYLSIVERAYHGTLEEQDDTILWISHMAKKAGADVSVLLRANAVNYAVQGQNAGGLTFGAAALSVPPKLDQDIVELIGAGVSVYAVSDDLERRGIGRGDIVAGVRLIGQREMAKLFDEHDQIWHW